MIKSYINELLEDVRLCPNDKGVIVYNRDSKGFSDYYNSVEDFNDDKMRYIDEKYEVQYLFTILCYLIALDRKKWTPSGVAITACRNVLGLSQANFAKKIEMPLRTVENWEMAVNEPRIDALIKVVKATSINFDVFFNTIEILNSLKEKI